MAQPFTFKVKNNIKEFTKGMNRKQREQVPFAVATALNATAFDLRKYTISRIFPNAFKNQSRAKGLARGIFRVRKTDKNKYKQGIGVARVFDSRGLDYLVRQQEGGMKTAKSGRFIAVPTPETQKKLGPRRRSAFRPEGLKGKANVVRTKVAGGKAREAIWQTGKKPKRFYSLVQSVRIPKTLNFYEMAKIYVKVRLRRNFARSIKKALKTAR